MRASDQKIGARQLAAQCSIFVRYNAQDFPVIMANDRSSASIGCAPDHHQKAKPTIAKHIRPALVAARISRMLPIADALAEAPEPETDSDEALEVPVPVAVLAESNSALDVAEASTIVVDSMLDAAVGVSEMVAVVYLELADVDKGWLLHNFWQLEYDVLLGWVVLPCG
jgi:hypothetical protein